MSTPTASFVSTATLALSVMALTANAGAQSLAAPASDVFLDDMTRHIETLDSLACSPAAGAITIAYEASAAALAADPTLAEEFVQRFAYGGGRSTYTSAHAEVLQRGAERVVIDHQARRVVYTTAAPPPPPPSAAFATMDTAMLKRMASVVEWAAAKTGQRIYHVPLAGELGISRAHMTYDVARRRFVATRVEPSAGGAHSGGAPSPFGPLPPGVTALRVAYDLHPTSSSPVADPAAYVLDGRPRGACEGYALVAQ